MQTTNVNIGKGSRFDVLNEDVEVLVNKDHISSKGKNIAGKGYKYNNVLKEITNLKKKPGEIMSKVPSPSSLKILKKGDKVFMPRSRPNVAYNILGGPSSSKEDSGSKGLEEAMANVSE
ncbi:hypothetical protein Q3G72_016747 [Acer saccharum]|nr:hypothetical protein Q3G72_016747 [Acer saccharum]